MSEAPKYFDLEIDDIIRFYVGADECEYPLTFTVKECVEEYCAMRNINLVRILEDPRIGRIRSGEFWYNKTERVEITNNVQTVQREQIQDWIVDWLSENEE